MLPSEVEFESLRFRNFKEERYGEDRVDDLDRLEEAEERTVFVRVATLSQPKRSIAGILSRRHGLEKDSIYTRSAQVISFMGGTVRNF